MKRALLGLVLLAIPAAAQTYSVVDMGVLRGGSARVHAMNAAGTVVGGSGFAYGTDRHAFIWRGDRMRELGRVPGGDISEAFGINDRGEVVGTTNTGTSMRGFLWTSKSGLQLLPTLPDTNASQAFAINAAGQIAGSAGTHAALWYNGAVQDLGTLPGSDWSEAHGLNNSGQVVGASNDGEGIRAVLWNAGAIQDLGTLSGDNSSRANYINDPGMIVGASAGQNRVRAFRWDRGSGMQDLGTLPGGTYSEAFGLNNAGHIVGSSGSAFGTRAFLWTSSSGMVDLNTLVDAPANVVLTGAFAINEKDQIVAYGLDEPDINRNREARDDQRHTAGNHVYLLIPR